MVYRAITVLAICSLMVSAMAQGNVKKHTSKVVTAPAFVTPGPAAAAPFIVGLVSAVRRRRAK